MKLRVFFEVLIDMDLTGLENMFQVEKEINKIIKINSKDNRELSIYGFQKVNDENAIACCDNVRKGTWK